MGIAPRFSGPRGPMGSRLNEKIQCDLLNRTGVQVPRVDPTGKINRLADHMTGVVAKTGFGLSREYVHSKSPAARV